MNKTVIIPFELDESPYYSLKPLLHHTTVFSGNRLLHSFNLIRRWTRMKALEMAADINIFNSKVFIWCDSDLLSDDNGLLFNQSLDLLDNGHITIPYQYNTAPKELTNVENVYKSPRRRMISSVISVPSYLIKDLMLLWTQQLRKNLETGHPVSDEKILACVKASKPEMFKCYQSDDKNVIANIRGLRTNASLIIENLRHCNGLLYHRGVAEIAPLLLDRVSVDGGLHTVNEILQIYNEILIGCWYLEDKRDLSRDAAVKMEKLIPMATLPPNMIQNMKSNLGFHEIKMD